MTDQNQQKALSKEQIDSVIALYSSGQYQEAIDQIKILNGLYPNVPFLFNLVGACYKELGQLEGAAKMFEAAVGIKLDYAEAHKNLGITLRDLGQKEQAIESLKKAIEIDSNYVDAYYNLAITFKDLDQVEESVQIYKKVIEINPKFAQAHNNLGNIYKGLGKNKEAIQSFEEAIKINPNFAQAHNNLGNIFKDLGQPNDAIQSYKTAIEIKPDFAEFYYNLGLSLKNIAKFDEAIISFNDAIANNPNFAEAHNDLGSCFTLLGQMSKALDSYKKAIAIKPDFAEAHNNLGNVFNLMGKVKSAIKSFELAVSFDADFAEALNSLANVFKKLKKRSKALLYYENAAAINPDLDFIFGDILNIKMHLSIWNDLPINLKDLEKKINNKEKVIDPFNLMGLIDDPALQRIATEVRINSAYSQNYTLPQINDYLRHSKIRIGYFSADFREHPVGFLTAELYELHDRDHFEIHAFSYGLETNGVINLRIKAGVDYFHNVDLMSHKEIVLLARSLEIDIAVDLGGLTGRSRTSIFAMSAAPIQLSYIGYLGTMGADYYDYLIADPMMIPQESQKHYVEKIVYLPSFQVNDSKDLPPEITLTRKEVGLPDKGFVFCCFNNTYKFTPTVFDSWARILKAVEGSVLLIYVDNNSAEVNLTQEIIKRNIKPNRLIFGERLQREAYLARYRVADLFLDTHPYNAGTTASDALKMGVPMLTYIGRSYQARMGASILNSINLPELITNSLEEYESLAIELASNPDKLKKIKDKLQSNLTTAPLFNTPLFTKNIESAYTQMYERHHAGLEPDHIYVE